MTLNQPGYLQALPYHLDISIEISIKYGLIRRKKKRERKKGLVVQVEGTPYSMDYQVHG